MSSSKYYCEVCYYSTGLISDFNKHKLTAKHKKRENGDVLVTISRQKCHNSLYCDICDYSTKKQCDLDKHKCTTKHLNKLAILQNPNNTIHHNNPDTTVSNTCNRCHKKYVHYRSLWRHQQQCYNREPSDVESKIIMNKILEAMTKNNEIQNTLIEHNQTVMDKLSSSTFIQNNMNNTNSTTNNNQFNINVFLNETCKDAINITDFISSLKLQTSDFEETGRLGYVEGITKIILKSLKEYDVEKRPLHCTDIKRDTIYVKHNDVWEKDNEDKKYFNWAVGAVAQLNFNQHVEWQREHPDCITNNSKENIQFMQLASAALGGGRSPDELGKFREKIMKNVLKEIVIGKNK
jgi:hypothetical protein